MPEAAGFRDAETQLSPACEHLPCSFSASADPSLVGLCVAMISARGEFCFNCFSALPRDCAPPGQHRKRNGRPETRPAQWRGARRKGREAGARRRRRGWAAGLSLPSAAVRPSPHTARLRCLAHRAGRGGRGPPAGWCRSPRAHASGRSRPASWPAPQRQASGRLGSGCALPRLRAAEDVRWSGRQPQRQKWGRPYFFTGPSCHRRPGGHAGRRDPADVQHRTERRPTERKRWGTLPFPNGKPRRPPACRRINLVGAPLPTTSATMAGGRRPAAGAARRSGCPWPRGKPPPWPPRSAPRPAPRAAAPARTCPRDRPPRGPRPASRCSLRASIRWSRGGCVPGPPKA
jgi:hypothetical protein